MAVVLARVYVGIPEGRRGLRSEVEERRGDDWDL